MVYVSDDQDSQTFLVDERERESLGNQFRADFDPGLEAAMDRALVGDLEKAVSLFFVEVSLDEDLPLDGVLPNLLPGFVGFIPLVVPKPNLDGLERPLLVIGIHPQGHGRAGAETGKEKIIGSRPGIGAPDGGRFIGDETVAPGPDIGPESFSMETHHGVAVFRIRGFRGEVSLGPGGDGAGGIVGIGFPSQEVVGVIERDEALGVLRAIVDATGVVDADDFVDGRVEYEKGFPKLSGGVFGRDLFEIVDELLPDEKLASSKRNGGFPLFPDLVEFPGEEMGDMDRIGRSTDRGDGTDGFDERSGPENRGSPEGVTDQDLGSFGDFLEVERGTIKIVDVRAEGRIGEFTFALSQARKIETENGDAEIGESLRDGADRLEILSAGEAVCEQEVGTRFADTGQVEPIVLLSPGLRSSPRLRKRSQSCLARAQDGRIPPRGEERAVCRVSEKSR